MSMPGMSLYGFGRSSMVGCCITDISLCIDQVISGSGILFCNKKSTLFHDNVCLARPRKARQASRDSR